jgi:RND superfamily putative drug exporter
VSIPSVGPTLGILIGLGVGIDYALFIVTRHRSNLKTGMPPREAAVRALNTSGRAVLFADTTVCIALIAMLVLRISYISGLGIAAAAAVMLVLAIPVLSLRLGTSDAANDPASTQCHLPARCPS